MTNGFLRYETELVHYFEDYYFDGKGDMFRYAELKDNTPNLANRQIAHIGLTKLYQRFTALFSIFEQLYDLFYAVYSEYETGSYTAHLSRTDIEAIAD